MSMTWAESLQAATEREEKKWSALLLDLNVAALDNGGLLQLFNSNFSSPASKSGSEAFTILKTEIRSRLECGRINQAELDRWGVDFVQAVMQ